MRLLMDKKLVNVSGEDVNIAKHPPQLSGHVDLWISGCTVSICTMIRKQNSSYMKLRVTRKHSNLKDDKHPDGSYQRHKASHSKMIRVVNE